MGNSEDGSAGPHSTFRVPHSVAWELGVGTAVLFALPACAAACPGCKEALFEPGKIGQNLSTARGYALSVVLMLAVPMLLIGGITTLILRARRRSPRSGIDTPKLSR